MMSVYDLMLGMMGGNIHSLEEIIRDFHITSLPVSSSVSFFPICSLIILPRLLTQDLNHVTQDKLITRLRG